jgi:hypothetical protein
MCVLCLEIAKINKLIHDECSLFHWHHQIFVWLDNKKTMELSELGITGKCVGELQIHFVCNDLCDIQKLLVIDLHRKKNFGCFNLLILETSS